MFSQKNRFYQKTCFHQKHVYSQKTYFNQITCFTQKHVFIKNMFSQKTKVFTNKSVYTKKSVFTNNIFTPKKWVQMGSNVSKWSKLVKIGQKKSTKRQKNFNKLKLITN